MFKLNQYYINDTGICFKFLRYISNFGTPEYKCVPWQLQFMFYSILNMYLTCCHLDTDIVTIRISCI